MAKSGHSPLCLSSLHRAARNAVAMIFKSQRSHKPNREIRVTVLVKFWQEDDVWNASAMDLPVAVFGESFEKARSNFEDAIISHFETLCELGRIEKTMDHLKRLERGRSFYERLPARQTFEKILVNPQEPCLVQV